MDKQEKTRADQYDHNNHLPKDILNKQQDPNSFRDPLEQQLDKEKTTNETTKNNNRGGKAEEER